MAKKIRIGIDIRDLRISKTGARTYLEEICAVFAQNDGDFEFFFIDTFLPVYTGRNRFFKLIEQFRFQIWKQFILPLKTWQKRCDILFCTDYFVPLWHPGFITIPVFHDAFFWEYPEHYNRYWRSLFFTLGVGGAKRSPIIITPTSYARKRISFFSGIDEKRIVPVFEAPKSLRKEQTADTASGLPEIFSRPYILHVGTFEKRKNLAVLIEAFEKLLQNGYPDYSLVLIGQASPKKDMDATASLLQIIQQKKLETKILFPGYVSDGVLHLYYEHAALYVFPSKNEGFGLPVLEAFQCGVPVLIADNSCLPEIAGDAAIGFNPDNADELFYKIKTLLDNPDLRESLIQKGNIRLKAFSWEKTGSVLKSLFKEVCSVR